MGKIPSMAEINRRHRQIRVMEMLGTILGWIVGLLLGVLVRWILPLVVGVIIAIPLTLALWFMLDVTGVTK